MHQQGDFQQAASCYEESLRLNIERVGDKGILVRTLYSQSSLAVAQGNPERAARLLGAYIVLRDATGSTLRRSILNQDDDQMVTVIREALGEKAFETAWAEGQAMAMEEAIEFSLLVS